MADHKTPKHLLTFIVARCRVSAPHALKRREQARIRITRTIAQGRRPHEVYIHELV